MKIQIPIYRAKKIDSDEWVEGYLCKRGNNYAIQVDERYTSLKIDPNTLAIHFPNMIDKNGKKIFASLSEDGVGGDYIKFSDNYIPLVISGFNTNEPKGIKLICMHTLSMMDSYKYQVIGIHLKDSK